MAAGFVSCLLLVMAPRESKSASPVSDLPSSGLVLIFAAAALWSLNGALIKLIHADGHGPDGLVIAFYRSLFAGLALLPLARGKFHTLRSFRQPRGSGGGSHEPSRPVPLPHALRHSLFSWRPAAVACVAFFTLMTVCFVVANTKTEAANAIILQYTSTFWVFGLSGPLLGERPHSKDLWILGVAMVGIGVIFAGNASGDLLGLVIALGAGLFYALLTLMIRLLRDADPAAITVANNLGAALVLFPVVWFTGDLMISGRELVLLVIMGVVQLGLPYYLYSLGLARVRAYQAAVVTLLEPVLVPVWTYLAVREGVPMMTVIGGGVILAALLLFIRAARRSAALGGDGG